ncbi:MAG: hypothetical protein EBU66_18775 [Bacteroidetes bacterium]|nr:hypothetical protein [bacterium]NBP66677.1 hypothetical protein [Bacteroidota bacterium]
MNPKTPVVYSCETCYFITSNKKDYSRHLLSRKHQELNPKTTFAHCDGLEITPSIPIKPTEYECQYCNRLFRSRTTIYQHKVKCQQQHIEDTNYIVTPIQLDTITTEQIYNTNDNVICSNDNVTITKSMFMELLNNNREMMKILKSITDKPLSQMNNTTINSNNTNSHNNNNTFNMNMFLNEKCKDAMNMKDFVNSIQLNMTDMENMDRLGYVEGMSTIFIDNLNKTDVYKRPVHCSDVKRETLYVKENDQWEREGPDHAKMTKAVLAVEHKNVVLVNEWANANPRCLNSNTRENDKYFRLSKIVTDGDKEGNIAKVIRKVAKRVGIEKPVIETVSVGEEATNSLL